MWLAIKIIGNGNGLLVGAFMDRLPPLRSLRVIEDFAYSEPSGHIDISQLSEDHVEF